MEYTELKEQLSKELNDFPMAFAFSNEQFQEGLRKLNATKDQVISIWGSGFIRKSDRKAFREMLADHSTRMSKALKDDAFMIEAITYELGNHEYCITWDDTDALRVLGLDRESEQVQRCLKEAKRVYNEWQEVYG